MAYNIVITGDNSDIKNAINETLDALQNMKKKAENSGQGLDDMFGKIKDAAAGVFAGFTVAEFIKKVVSARGEMQQLEVAFTTMLGSKSKANKLMEEMTQTALITPFEFNDVANGARQLIAYGEGADTVNDTLVRLGNVASGLSQPLNDIVYLYGTTRVQGRLFSQDLNQFTNRGIPMIQKLAEQFGVTEAEVKNLVSAGKVGFPEVQKVIEDLTNEGGMFYNLMEEQSKTISGQISNLQDQFSNIFNEIGKSSEGVITSVLEGAAEVLDHWESIGKALVSVASAYGVVKATAMAYVAVQKASAALQNAGGIAKYVQGLLGLNKALQGATAAQKAMNVAAMANPYAILAAAVVGLCYGLYKLVTATDAAEDAQAKFNERVGEAEASAAQSFDTLRELESAYGKTKEGTEAYNAELAKLQELYPDIIKAHTDSATGLLDIVAAEREVQAAIEKRIATEELANVKSEMAQAKFKAQRDEMQTYYDDIKENMQDLFASKGSDKVEAADKAKRAAQTYRDTLLANMRGFDFSQYDMLSSDGAQRALSDFQKMVYNATRSANEQIRGEYNLTEKELESALRFQSRFGDVATTGWAGYFNNTIEAYVDEAKQVAKAQEMLGVYINSGAREDETAGATSVEKETKQVDALTKAWETYLGLLKDRDAAIKNGDKAGEEADNKQIKTEQQKIIALEKELQGHKAITEEIKKWDSDELKNYTLTASEGSFRQAQVARLQAADPEATKKKDTATKETSRAELSEEQKIAIQRVKLAQTTEQAEIDAMEDGTAKKLRQIELDYEKRKLSIDQHEAELQAEADKSGNGLIRDEDAAALDNEELEAKNEYLKKLREVSQSVLDETASYWDKRAAIIKKGQANIANVKSLQSEGLISDKDATRRIEELTKGTEDAVAQMDMQQAQQDPAFKQWQATLTTMATNALKEGLAKSEQVLKSLEGNENVDDDELVKLRGQVSAYKEQLNQEEAKTTENEDKLGKAKAFVKLAKKIRVCVGQVGDLEEALTGTKSKATQACEAIMDFGLQLVDIIFQTAEGTMTATTTTAIQAAEAIKTVEKASVILAIIGAVIQAVTKLVQIFSDKSREEEKLQALQEYYSALKDVINDCIDRQEELLENATGDQVSSIVEKTSELYESQTSQYSSAAKASLQSYNGGKHTVGYHENKKVRDQFNNDKIYEITGVRVNYASDLADMSASQLLAIKENLPTLWASFNETFRTSLEGIIEVGDAVDDLKDKAAEVTLGFSFDDLQTEFTDFLTDMDADASDFCEDISENLRTSIITGLVYTSETKAKLQALYQKINDTMTDDSLTDEEKMALVAKTKQEINDYANEKKEEAAKYMEMAGLDSGSEATSAETAGFSGMTQETAEELNGRFTAIQGHTYLIQQNVATLATVHKSALESIQAIQNMTNTLCSLGATRNQIINQIYSLLSDINAKGLRLKS